jgi:SAM-dependent methyltransferase
VRIPYAACPLCESTELVADHLGNCSYHLLYREPLPPTMQWMRCQKCDHVFTDGYFTDEAFALIFADANPIQLPSWSTDHNSRIMNAKMVSAVVEVLGHRGGGWLDVGFGNGALMTAAEEFGFEVAGVDLRQAAVDAMQRMGYDARCCDITALEQDRQYDVVSLMDVLEHMPYPREGLAAADRLLTYDGVLYISMPNRDSFVWRSYDALGTNPYWGEIEHFHDFGLERLSSLLQEHGFEVARYDVSQRYFACMEVVARRVRKD